MKKSALVLALAASIFAANAQNKSLQSVQAAVEKAKEASLNPKKATKLATWIKLGQSYLEAYAAPQGDGWIGASKQDLSLVMGTVKPLSTENVTLEGVPMTKDSYANCDYYFRDGILTMIDVTKPAFPDALGEALKAYEQAAKLDVKKSKAKDITAAAATIVKGYVEQAYNAYSFGDYKKASSLFESAANASTSPISAVVDTNSFYHAGLTAWIAKDYDSAERLFKTCIDSYKYEGNEGDVYAKLADIYEKTDKKSEMKDILERGFQNFPQSQPVLVGLINYYISNNEDPARLYDLLGQAKKNEPGNASLWYVEGTVNKELGKIDEAIAAYEKCSEINPEYEFGYIGEGILFYNQAIEIQDKAANEMDDAKYMVLAEQFEKSLKNCIAPFEKAFNITKDNSLKVNIAEYLKNACYRFISESEEYKAAYDKYAKIVADGKVE